MPDLNRAKQGKQVQENSQTGANGQADPTARHANSQTAAKRCFYPATLLPSHGPRANGKLRGGAVDIIRFGLSAIASEPHFRSCQKHNFISHPSHHTATQFNCPRTQLASQPSQNCTPRGSSTQRNHVSSTTSPPLGAAVDAGGAAAQPESSAAPPHELRAGGRQRRAQDGKCLYARAPPRARACRGFHRLVFVSCRGVTFCRVSLLRGFCESVSVPWLLPTSICP